VELVTRKETVMAAQMTSMFIRCHQYVFILSNRLEWNATSADDGVVLNIVNQSGNTNILNAITSRTIMIIRFKTFVFVEFPINLLFILHEAFTVAVEFTEVNANLVVQWDQLIHVCVEDFFVFLSCSSV